MEMKIPSDVTLLVILMGKQIQPFLNRIAGSNVSRKIFVFCNLNRGFDGFSRIN